jgi:hypothetical protein
MRVSFMMRNSAPCSIEAQVIVRLGSGESPGLPDAHASSPPYQRWSPRLRHPGRNANRVDQSRRTAGTGDRSRGTETLQRGLFHSGGGIRTRDLRVRAAACTREGPSRLGGAVRLLRPDSTRQRAPALCEERGTGLIGVDASNATSAATARPPLLLACRVRVWGVRSARFAASRTAYARASRHRCHRGWPGRAGYERRATGTRA